MYEINIGYAKLAVLCPVNSLLVIQSMVSMANQQCPREHLCNVQKGIIPLQQESKFSIFRQILTWLKKMCEYVGVCMCVCVCVCVARKIWSSQNFDYLIYFLLIQAWAI